MDSEAKQVQTAADAGTTSKAAISAFASLAPLYFLLSLKSRVGLDHLHIGLFQIIIFLAFRSALDLPGLPFSLAARASAVSRSAIAEGPSSSATKRAAKPGGGKKRTNGVKRTGGFTPEALDQTLHKFLSIVEPEYCSRLPTPAPRDAPAPLPLDHWKTIHSAEGVSVLEHPTLPALYAISAHLPDVPLKQLFGLLVDVHARPSWDGLCEEAEQVEEVRDGTGRVASCSYMRMKGMWPVKPKDLVLLSVITRLPPSASRLPSSADDPVTRLVCATSSVAHPLKPPQPGYTRMNLSISGFMAESDAASGSRIVQITDLSGLGKVPGFIISTVTGKLIPASLKKVGNVAKGHKSTRFPDDEKDESWVPPVVGDWEPGKDPEGAKRTAEAAVDGGDGEGEEEGDDGFPSDQAKNFRVLLAQLRAVTNQLAELESASPSPPSDPTGGASFWLSRFGFGGMRSKSQDQALETGWPVSVAVAGATVAVGAAWSLIRRQRKK